MARRLQTKGYPYGSSTRTGSLGDETQALAKAFSQVEAYSHCKLRSRLRLMAEEHPAVLMLDRVTTVTTAIKGFFVG